MWQKLVLSSFVLLSNWLLTLLDNCTYWLAEALAVFCIFAAVHWSNPVLTACWFWSFYTCVSTASLSYCRCNIWLRMPWNSALLGISFWLHARALSLRRCGWNCNGMLWITSSVLLSMYCASAPVGEEHESTCGSPHCCSSCYPFKLKTNPQRL